MNNNSYQPEIDGLRAVSVLVIIFYHLGVTAFSGGFIGVDVFFVISGYLITRIIVNNLNAGEFSFKDFYIRRATRILPALVVTILLVLSLAMTLQHPRALVHTAQESISALLSLSNIFYWMETDYWAPAADNYALLHTWSLGVEEQFYLVYPLLLVLAHRVAGARGVIFLLIGIAILGTVASESILTTARSAAFYFTPLRFYEFAFGGLAATLPSLAVLQKYSRVSAVITMTGLGLVLYACLRFNGSLALPGILVLIPISGALLVLLAGPSPVARVLLMNPAMSRAGKISYSLYLIHWPIIVFSRPYFGTNPSVAEQSVLFVLILLAGALLNRIVERKFRLSHDGKRTASGLSSNKVMAGTAGVALLVVAVSTTLIISKGWPTRMPESAQALLEIKPQKDWRLRQKILQERCKPKGDIFCGVRQPDKTNILLLGDSRSLDIYIALQTAYPDANIQVSFAMGCAPVFSEPASFSLFYSNCYEFNQTRLRAALEAPAEDIIILAQDLLSWRLDGILKTVERLREAGKIVYLLGDFTMTTQISPIEIEIEALRFPGRGDTVERYMSKTPFLLDGEFANQITAWGATYISYKPFFFDGEYHFTDRESGKLLTYDGIHLNVFGATQFGEYLRQHYPLP